MGMGATPRSRAGGPRATVHGRARALDRACTAHPRRVFLGWIGIIAVLIVLVATVGGA